MSPFFQELKRRKVLKTLGVYGAAAIVIIQLASSIFPFLYLPKWTVTFVIVLIILGFPITFFLSWTYDLKRDNERDDQSKIEEEKTPIIKLKQMGKRKFRFILLIEVLRHANKGAIPVNASKTSPNGISF